jgi:chitinase
MERRPGARNNRDFKNLNNAKFTVLNEMAPTVDFDASNPGAITSFCPFDKEWKKLSELSALQEVGRSNLIALKSSNIEYFIPKAFAALFVAIMLALIIVVVDNWPPSSLVQKPVAATASAPTARTP